MFVPRLCKRVRGSGERDLDVPTDSEQCAFELKGPNVPQGASHPALGTGYRLGAAISEGHEAVKEHPKEVCEDGEVSAGQGV